jgi:hypothetical protein
LDATGRAIRAGGYENGVDVLETNRHRIQRAAMARWGFPNNRNATAGRHGTRSVIGEIVGRMDMVR